MEGKIEELPLGSVADVDGELYVLKLGLVPDGESIIYEQFWVKGPPPGENQIVLALGARIRIGDTTYTVSIGLAPQAGGNMRSLVKIARYYGFKTVEDFVMSDLFTLVSRPD